MTSDNFNQTTSDRDSREAYDAIPIISYAELMAVFNRWMLIVDPGVVKLVHAVIFANKIDSDPVWLNLIAPSAGGKTAILDSFLKVPECYAISTLTSNTFLSGYKSKEKTPSLLHQLGSGKTLIFKDFTSLLDGNWDETKAIMGQLREVYDQRVVKRTGTGEELVWEGKLGFIAGCTPIIEQKFNLLGAMGERFLNYTMKQPKRAALRKKMKENVGKGKEMKEAMQIASTGFQKSLVVPDELPTMPPEVEKMIDGLTDFIAISRAVVIRANDTKKEIDWIAPPEMSGRVFKQFYTLAIALLIINKGQWFEEDTYILRQLAISSVHSIRYNLIRHTMTYKGQVKTSTLASTLGYPTSTTRRYLEDLAAISMDDGEIKILHRTHQGAGKADLWEVTPEMKAILYDMGERSEPTKEDTDLDEDEKDVAVGNGTYHMGSIKIKQQEAEDLAGDLSPDERLELGI